MGSFFKLALDMITERGFWLIVFKLVRLDNGKGFFGQFSSNLITGRGFDRFSSNLLGLDNGKGGGYCSILKMH